jgi:RHS repeat-associated protein
MAHLRIPRPNTFSRLALTLFLLLTLLFVQRTWSLPAPRTIPKSHTTSTLGATKISHRSAIQLPGEVAAPFRVNVIPPSPEAAALAKYADIPVNLYTGTPDITLPLFDIRDRDLSLPVALTYHTSGHKVEDEASRTGLGWSLQAGGVITRSIRGLPDEYGPHPAGFLHQAAEMSPLGGVGGYALGTPDRRAQWYESMATGCRDAEPDVFYFNFSGHSGRFHFDWNGHIVLDSAAKVTITPIGLDPNGQSFIQGWRVQTPDGRTYIFDVQERASIKYLHPIVISDPCRAIMDTKQPPQSWLLSQITSSVSNSVIVLKYDNYTQTSERWSLETQTHNRVLADASPLREKLRSEIQGKYLKSIETSSRETTADFLPGIARTDVQGTNLHTLGVVRVRDRHDTVVRNWDLSYDYRTGRLTLISVQESAGNHTLPPYRFGYYPGHLPGPLSFQMDHWGFPNNNSEDTLIPATVARQATPDGDWMRLSGADRSPAPNLLTIGMLKTIVYPTGGTDTFEFEPHAYSYEQNRKLQSQQTEHRLFAGSAPANDTAPGVEHVEAFDFDLERKTDLELTVVVTYGCSFACGNLLGVRLKRNGDMVPLVDMIPEGQNPEHDPDPEIPEGEEETTTSVHVVNLIDVKPGQYQFTVRGKFLSAQFGKNRVDATLEWDQPTGEVITLIKQGAGVRIAKVTSATGFGNPDQVTNYLYTIRDGTTDISSGSLLESLQVYDLWIDYFSPEVPNGFDPRFVRFSQNRTALGTTQGSHVGYQQVTVVRGENGANGRSVYQYTSPIDFPDFPSSEVPFPPAWSQDLSRGLLLKQLDYAANSSTPMRTITNKYSVIRHEVPGLKVGWKHPGPGPTGAEFLERYAWAGYTNRLGYARLIETEVSLAFPLSSQTDLTFQTRSAFEYDEDGHKQLTKTTSVDSEGIEIVTAYKYPTDYPGGTSPALDWLVDNHQIGPVVEKVTYTRRNDVNVRLVSVVSALKQQFGLFAGRARVSEVSSARIGAPILTADPFQTIQSLYESRLSYHAYDDFGNVLEHSQPGGLITSYVWDATATLPIAVADHAPANQIFHTSFEDGNEGTLGEAHTGTRSLVIHGAYTLPTSNLPAAPGDYLLSYWQKAAAASWLLTVDTVRNYQPGDPISTQPVSGRLDDIRLHPVPSRMKTFTYGPQTELTSATSLAHLSTYYDYDAFRRLIATRDHNGNIITAHDYAIGYTPATDSGVNYVRTFVPQDEGWRTWPQVLAATAAGVEGIIQDTGYVDGKARLIQRVRKGSSPSHRDVVKIVSYDPFGRQARKALPFTMNPANGDYKVFDESTHPLVKFYQATNDAVPNTRRPVAVTRYDGSPLNRIVETGAPGEPWQPDAPDSHTTRIAYTTNTARDAVRLWRPVDGGLKATDTYVAGSLQVTVTRDENGHARWIFADRQGRVVLRVDRRENGEQLQTYSVYDDKGNLISVIPPKAVQAAVTSQPAEVFDRDIYRYVYDERNRVVERYQPGAGPTYLIYDPWDRLVLSQDGEQRRRREWIFHKYDAFDREILRGVVMLPGKRSEVAREVADFYATAPRVFRRYEDTGDVHGYTNRSFPVLSGSVGVDIAMYYDDYSFRLGFPSPSRYEFTRELELTTFLSRPVGQQTGTKVRVFGSQDFGHFVTYYDDQLNAIQTVRTNHNGSHDRTTRVYSFVGNPVKELSTHDQAGVITRVTKESTYDHAGRLKDVFHRVNDRKKVLLYNQRYNELDKIIEKNFYSTDGGATFAQSVDYRYNIRDWLTSINNASLTAEADINDDDGDLFGVDLYYNERANGLANTAQYDGKISAVKWKTAHLKEEQSYVYNYDTFGRLREAHYANHAADAKQGAYNEGPMAYDSNGNLTRIDRHAWAVDRTVLIDALTYSYDGNGDQVLRISDASERTEGFNGKGNPFDEPYEYDANGNMVKDPERNVTLTYNQLNLLEEVRRAPQESIRYTYDASGVKLAKVVSSNGEASTEYVGAFVYKNGTLQYVRHEHGRIVSIPGGPEWSYQYYLTDHLGSVRLTFAPRSGEGPQQGQPAIQAPKMLHADDYYAFGLQLGGNHFRRLDADPIEHLYNGKEVQDDLGIHWYDYGSRMYDASIGRWHNRDALAEEYNTVSPYVYALNDPIRYRGPDGRGPAETADARAQMPKDWKYEGPVFSLSAAFGFVGEVLGAVMASNMANAPGENPDGSQRTTYNSRTLRDEVTDLGVTLLSAGAGKLLKGAVKGARKISAVARKAPVVARRIAGKSGQSWEAAAQELAGEIHQLAKGKATGVTKVVRSSEGEDYILGVVTGNDGERVLAGADIAEYVEDFARDRGIRAEVFVGSRVPRVHAEEALEVLMITENVTAVSPAYLTRAPCGPVCERAAQAIDAIVLESAE